MTHQEENRGFLPDRPHLHSVTITKQRTKGGSSSSRTKLLPPCPCRHWFWAGVGSGVGPTRPMGGGAAAGQSGSCAPSWANYSKGRCSNQSHHSRTLQQKHLLVLAESTEHKRGGFHAALGGELRTAAKPNQVGAPSCECLQQLSCFQTHQLKLGTEG